MKEMKFFPIKVEEIVEETPLARSFVFAPEERHQDKFSYRAGQFMTFRIPWKGSSIERCYSLSSSPGSGPGLKVTVKRVVGGKGSNWFNDTLKLGDLIEASQPSGRFVCREISSSLRFFAGGSGITPVISIIREALTHTRQNISLFYANKDQESVIFAKELQSLQAQYSARFVCNYHYDCDDGYVDMGKFENFANHADDQFHFICGPRPFMELAEEFLAGLGVDDRRVLIERFTSPDDLSAVEAVTPAPLQTSLGIATTFRVILDELAHEVNCASNQTLLEAMLEADLDPLHRCKDGHCGSCMVICSSGEVAMAKTTALSKRDKEKGYILLCQAKPLTSDVSVDCDA